MNQEITTKKVYFQNNSSFQFYVYKLCMICAFCFTKNLIKFIFLHLKKISIDYCVRSITVYRSHFTMKRFQLKNPVREVNTLISELKMTLYERESLGFLLVLIEMRHYFLKTT